MASQKQIVEVQAQQQPEPESGIKQKPETENRPTDPESQVIERLRAASEQYSEESSNRMGYETEGEVFKPAEEYINRTEA